VNANTVTGFPYQTASWVPIVFGATFWSNACRASPPLRVRAGASAFPTALAPTRRALSFC